MTDAVKTPTVGRPPTTKPLRTTLVYASLLTVLAALLWSVLRSIDLTPIQTASIYTALLVGVLAWVLMLTNVPVDQGGVKPFPRATVPLILLLGVLLAIPGIRGLGVDILHSRAVLRAVSSLPANLPYTASLETGEQLSGTLTRQQALCGGASLLRAGALSGGFALQDPPKAGVFERPNLHPLKFVRTSDQLTSLLRGLSNERLHWLAGTQGCPGTYIWDDRSAVTVLTRGVQ